MHTLSKRPQNNPINNPAFFEKCRIATQEKSTATKEKYNSNPKICLECLKPLDYDKRKNKFCNSSCSATYTNKNRSEEEIKLRVEAIRKKHNCDGLNAIELHQHRRNLVNSKKLAVEVCGPICMVYLINCKKCSRDYYAWRQSSKYCTQCILNDRKIYRASCKFYLNNKDNSFLFNAELIKKYGWYAPHNSSKPNLKGVTWDHLFRIEDGYLLNVNSAIMSHPANAELVPWEQNIARKKSMITYDELLERIKLYELGQIDKLTYYYKE